MGATGKKSTAAPTTTTTQQPQKQYIDFDTLTHDQRRALVTQMQGEMGQTGFEAGDANASPSNKLYVGTSKAYNINYYLNTDGKSIDSSDSQWQNYGYGVKDVEKAIKQIDAGMKPISQDILASRYVTANSLGRMLGVKLDATSVGVIINNMKNDPNAVANFNDLVSNATYVQKAYSSLSYRKGHSTFDNYPVRLNVKVNKGTSAIMTNNHAEHEVLAGRGLKYNFSNARVVSEWSKHDKAAKDYLVIDVDLY